VSGVPILVEGTGLRVLVVGGGRVAARRAELFAAAGATVRLVAPQLCEALDALTREHAVAVEPRRYERGDIGDAQLVIAATNDRAVNAAVAADARAANRLVNVVDAADDGTFAVMAAHRAGALTIGVSAGGVPTAASRIRDAIASRFDARYGDAVEQLAACRRELLAGGQGESWRERSTSLIDDSFCDAVERGTLAERLAVWP
jgi:siroheme synthase-like protein